MENSAHFKKLENMYLSANVNKNAEYEIHVIEKKAEIKLKIQPEMFHAAGAVHGSYMFKLLDDAAFFAASSVIEDVFLLTTNFSVNMLRPVNKGELRAVGKLVFASKHLLVAEAAIYDEHSKVIAFGTGNFAKSKLPLNDEVGYFTEDEPAPEDEILTDEELNANIDPNAYPGDDAPIGDPYAPLH